MSFDPENVRRFDHPPKMGVFMTIQDGGAYVLYEDFDKLKSLLHEVSTDADPAGTVRELAVAKETIAALEKEVEELKERIKNG